jgi:lipopolysaccharide biosynthesis regulator YciM
MLMNEIGLENDETVLAVAATPTPAPVAKRSLGATMLERHFAMAQRYLKAGNYSHATEMFWMLVDEHSETPQAEAAKAELLTLAEGYERAGKYHMARSMYEQLMEMED